MKKALCLVMVAFMLCIAGCQSGSQSEEEVETGKHSNGIPVLNLEIDPDEFAAVNESGDHSYRAEGASISIDIPEGYSNEFGDSFESSQMMELDYIRGRGHGTWTADKKPYRFKLKDSEDLLGMGSNKHWVLLANRYDTTLLRNRIVAYIGRQMGMPFIPKAVPVDLVVNGEYYGSYVLSEQIRIGKNRIAIDELSPEDVSEPEITGGYLVCLNPSYEEAPENIAVSDRLVRFGFESPQFTEDENGTAEQKAYMIGYLQDIENSIFAGDGNYADLMDLRSAADYWWIQEFSGNHDAFITSSTYLYKERSGKLYWGPLWDFDLSLGGGLDALDGFEHRNMIWLDQLRANDPEYRRILRERWEVLDGIIDEVVKDGGVIDRYVNELEASYNDDQERWIITDDDGHEIRYDLREEAENLKEWMKKRQEWISRNIDSELSHVYNTVTFVADDNEFRSENVLVGRSLDRLPQAPYKEGYIFSHWEYGDGRPYEYENIDENIVLTAVYLTREEAGVTEGIFFVDPKEVWADINDKRYDAVFELLPEETIDKSIVWSSSDTAIAEVDETGTVIMKHTGEVTIDATLNTGAHSSFVLHIYDPVMVEKSSSGHMIVEEEIIMEIGEYRQIQVSLEPSFSESNLQYTCDNEEIASVDYFGVVHAISAGEATVTVSNGSDNGESETVIIIVR